MKSCQARNVLYHSKCHVLEVETVRAADNQTQQAERIFFNLGAFYNPPTPSHIILRSVLKDTDPIGSHDSCSFLLKLKHCITAFLQCISILASTNYCRIRKLLRSNRSSSHSELARDRKPSSSRNSLAILQTNGTIPQSSPVQRIALSENVQ